MEFPLENLNGLLLPLAALTVISGLVGLFIGMLWRRSKAGEMEEKAREQVLALVPINNNVLSGVVVHRWRDWAKSGSEIAVRFNLNGRDYTVQATFDDADFDWEGAVRDLVKALSGKIAESILGQVLEQVGPAPRRQ